MPPPVVNPTVQCNIFESDGSCCPNLTGSDTPGVDADLCSEHRAVMQAQRERNSDEGLTRAN